MTLEDAKNEVKLLRRMAEMMRDRRMVEAIDTIINSSQLTQKVIMCKDCDEWHRGKCRDGSDTYSDVGYCCVHRILTGEHYYCGDAERR